MSVADASTAHLMGFLKGGRDNLWLADENALDLWPALAKYAPGLQVMSNRWDVSQAAQRCGIRAEFSDWNFAAVSGPFDAVYLRICKEKAINLHLIEQAHRRLGLGGTLVLAGEKNEGIKSIWEFACRTFQWSEKPKKQGLIYAGALEKSAAVAPHGADSYHHLQVIGDWDGRPIFSKPGVYGWDKIDVGSALLIETLRADPTAWEKARSLLDLGCGYGFLTFASDWLPCQRRVATDNNAAALICTEKNAAERGLQVETVAADKADRVNDTFDLVLCNPPFHRGFDVDADLTRDFLAAAKAKLAKGGTAVFVVNSFIPLEKKAAGLFNGIRLLADTRQFKVVALQC